MKKMNRIFGKVILVSLFFITICSAVHARYYDPRLGRWITVDRALVLYLPDRLDPKQNLMDFKPQMDLPGMGGIFNPLNLNLYHYAGNNPVRFVDPDGNADNLFTKDIMAEPNSATEHSNATSADHQIIQRGSAPVIGAMKAGNNSSASATLRAKAAIGQEAHRQIQSEKMASGEWVNKEVKVDLNNGATVRKDGVKADGTFAIIKPDTPSGIKSAAKRESLMNDNGYKTETIFYNPNDTNYLPSSSTFIGPKNKGN